MLFNKLTSYHFVITKVEPILNRLAFSTHGKMCFTRFLLQRKITSWSRAALNVTGLSRRGNLLETPSCAGVDWSATRRQWRLCCCCCCCAWLTVSLMQPSRCRQMLVSHYRSVHCRRKALTGQPPRATRWRRYDLPAIRVTDVNLFQTGPRDSFHAAQSTAIVRLISKLWFFLLTARHVLWYPLLGGPFIYLLSCLLNVFWGTNVNCYDCDYETRTISWLVEWPLNKALIDGRLHLVHRWGNLTDCPT